MYSRSLGMKSNYKQLGRYICPVDVRNKGLVTTKLLGISVEKCFIPSIANIIGTDLEKYKIVRKGQFAYIPDTSRRGDKIAVALLREEECIISSAYTAFEIIDTNELDPEYLMLWFSRPEFDRYARFHSHGSVREIFGWDEMCRVELPVPDIEEQRNFVRSVNLLQHRIHMLERIGLIVEQSTQFIFDELISQEGNLATVDEWINFNPKRTLSKGMVASCFEMASLPIQGASLARGEKKPYNGGMRFRNGDTLIARITPCLENGKAAFVSGLSDNEVAFGSTEVIVMEAKNPEYEALPYFLVRNKKFIAFATEFLNGSSGRQRVSASQLASFKMPLIEKSELDKVASIGRRALAYLGMVSRQINVLRDTVYTLVNSNI